MRTAIACPEPDEPRVPDRLATWSLLVDPGTHAEWINWQRALTSSFTSADTWVVLDVQPRRN